MVDGGVVVESWGGGTLDIALGGGVVSPTGGGAKILVHLQTIAPHPYSPIPGSFDCVLPAPIISVIWCVARNVGFSGDVFRGLVLFVFCKQVAFRSSPTLSFPFRIFLVCSFAFPVIFWVVVAISENEGVDGDLVMLIC